MFVKSQHLETTSQKQTDLRSFGGYFSREVQVVSDIFSFCLKKLANEFVKITRVYRRQFKLWLRITLPDSSDKFAVAVNCQSC